MSNKMVFLTVVAGLILLSLAVLSATFASGDWRAFAVTETHLIVTAAALCYLLRDSHE